MITTMILPGIGLVLYGSIGEVSIGRLFAAGMIPGLLMTVFLMAVVGISAKQKGYRPEREKRATLKEMAVTFIVCIWAFLFPVMLILGLRAGMFTPSEAGAFACIYAILVGVLAYKELTWSKLVKTLESTVVDAGMAMILFGIIMVLTLTLGLLSPPEGAVLYIICTIFECKIWDFVKESWLMFLSILLVVLMVIFRPDVALWLPNLIYGKG